MDPLNDFLGFAYNHLNIVDKSGQLTNLKLNIYQAKLEACFQHQRKLGVPIRLIQLKARQVGGSTYGTAKLFGLTVQNPFCSSFIMAHDAESTDNLFRMVKTYYDFLDEAIRPMVKYSNQKMLDFRNPSAAPEEIDLNPGLRSVIQVGTAGNRKVGRSKTNRNAHLSECAFWDNAGTLITSVCQTVPAKPDTFILKESTANGMEGAQGEQFYLDWFDAVHGRSDWLPVFCPWWELDEYGMKVIRKFSPGDAKEKYGDEAGLYAFLKDSAPYRVGITVSEKGFDHDTIMRKLTWRRYKIDNDMGRDSALNPLDQFSQEYPATWEEAFLASGHPVFPNKELQRHIMELDLHPPATHAPDDFPERIRGGLTVFHKPEEGRQYAIGCDVSEGLAEGDASCAAVLDDNFRQCAVWYGRVDEDIFGEYVGELSKVYNNALYGIEVNNMGISSQRAAQKVAPNTYLRRIVDKITEDITLKPGWRTDVKTKRLLIVDLKGYYRDGGVKIYDKHTLRDMMTCVREPNGDVILNGKDRTVALGIAIQVCKEIPRIEHSVEFPQRMAEDATKHGSKEDYLQHLEEIRKRDEVDNWDTW